jgi:hypothetical protein
MGSQQKPGKFRVSKICFIAIFELSSLGFLAMNIDPSNFKEPSLGSPTTLQTTPQIPISLSVTWTFVYLKFYKNMHTESHLLWYDCIFRLHRHLSTKYFIQFCSTRKSAQSAAEKLVSQVTQMMSNPFIKSPAHRHELMELSKKISDKKLGELVAQGIAIHHGGQ